jgi:hypothetical protein
VQGVVKAYDPVTGDGVVMRDTDLSEYDLAAGTHGVRSVCASTHHTRCIPHG